MHCPLEHGPDKAAKVPPKDRYDVVASDFLDLGGQLATPAASKAAPESLRLVESNLLEEIKQSGFAERGK